MKKLMLAALAALAAPSQAQLPYDLQFPSGVAVAVVDWNGQPALLLWGRSRPMCEFAGVGGPYQRLAMDVRLSMFADARPCAIGASVGYDACAYGHWPAARMPASGLVLSSEAVALQHWTGCDRSTHYDVDYCPSPGWCDGCENGSNDGPQLWAAICTVRLL